MFQDLQNLEVIGLQENSLKSILNDTFGNLQNIQDIRLRENSLSSIFPGTFSNLPNLHYLWLGGNNLTALNQDILLAEGATMPVSNHVWIDLYQGSFQCDSRMCWILLGEHDGWLEINSLKCGNYPDLEWDGWRDLDLGDNNSSNDEMLLITCFLCHSSPVTIVQSYFLQVTRQGQKQDNHQNYNDTNLD